MKCDNFKAANIYNNGNCQGCEKWDKVENQCKISNKTAIIHEPVYQGRRNMILK